VLALLGARFLMRGGGADRGVKRNIAQVVTGGARLDIAAALALSARAGAAAAAPARDLVEGVG